MEQRTSNKTLDMVYTALFAVVMVICSFICIPTAIPFTLQTFAVFLAVAVLGGKRGSMAVFLYLLMGAIGLPVFVGFTGGIGRLFDATGGYLLGFLLAALVMWGAEHLFGKKDLVLCISMVLGLLLCYTFGTAWYLFLYGKTTEMSLAAVLSVCVIPFMIPDIIKIAMVLVLRKRLIKVLRLQ